MQTDLYINYKYTHIVFTAKRAAIVPVLLLIVKKSVCRQPHYFLLFALNQRIKMSKRKRVTADEKRTRTLQFFHEKREFYTLKELENLVPKETGVIQQAVKDVVQALVDDGLVHSDKIGTSVYFWSFPGQRVPILETQAGETGRKILTLETKLEHLKSDILKEEANKKEFNQTKEVLTEIDNLKNKETDLKKQIAKFSDADPEVIAECNKKAMFFKEAANTWTDNIFSLKTWCNSKFNIEESELNKQFNIPEDLDYVE